MQAAQSTRGGCALVGEMGRAGLPGGASVLRWTWLEAAAAAAVCARCSAGRGVLGAGRRVCLGVRARWCCGRRLRVVTSGQADRPPVCPGRHAHLSGGSIFAGLCGCATLTVTVGRQSARAAAVIAGGARGRCCCSTLGLPPVQCQSVRS